MSSKVESFRGPLGLTRMAGGIALCEDLQVLGTTFYIMEHVERRIFRDLLLPLIAPADRTANL